MFWLWQDSGVAANKNWSWIKCNKVTYTWLAVQMVPRHWALRAGLVAARGTAPPLALAQSYCSLVKMEQHPNLWQPCLIGPISLCCTSERCGVIVGIFGGNLFLMNHKDLAWCGNILYLTKLYTLVNSTFHIIHNLCLCISIIVSSFGPLHGPLKYPSINAYPLEKKETN